MAGFERNNGSQDHSADFEDQDNPESDNVAEEEGVDVARKYPEAEGVHDEEHHVEDYHSDGATDDHQHEREHHYYRVENECPHYTFAEGVDRPSEEVPVRWLQVAQTPACEVLAFGLFVLLDGLQLLRSEVSFLLHFLNLGGGVK